MDNKDPKIVIVGAGAAGLSAAHHLVQNGFQNVVILEATDRIGGRIHTVPFGDGIVEMGANWIHGIGEDNSMFTLAELKGLIQKPYVLLDSFYGDWLSENGVSFKEENIQKALNIAEKIQEELEGGCNAGQNTSCQEYFENRVAEEVGNFSDEDKEELRPVFNALLASFGDYMGDDPSLISAKLYDISKIISQDWVAIPNGYCGILEALQAEIPENAIQFGRFVTSVIWDNLSDRKAVKVVCNHGDDLEEYLADHVIITCSLGHLKQYHDSLFQPSLPREKSDAIERMGFGNVAKIFLHYEKPFWSVGNGGLTLALESYDSKDEKLWQKSIYKFSEVLTCPNTLLAWVHGNGVRHMESLKDEEVSRVCTELLKKFLHDDKIPEPTSIRISSWSTDPKFLGAYSYYAINSQPSDVEDIAKPLLRNNVPIVCFAGEATDIKWFSFVHGARSSGIREASRLVRLHLGQC